MLDLNEKSSLEKDQTKQPTKQSKQSTYSSEELLLHSDRSSSAEELEEFPYSSTEYPENLARNSVSTSELPVDDPDEEVQYEESSESGDLINESHVRGENSCKSSSLVLNTQCSNSENLLKCLFCDNHTNVATSRDTYLEHLKKTHRFIIANDHLIADFKRYIDFWRSKFANKDLTDFCSIIKTPMFPEDQGVPTVYLLLGDTPQDRRLREVLQQKRLKLVLERNQFERNDKNFCHNCVFCDTKFTNCNRSDIFEHMHSEHFFNVGHPDNLVFVSELLNVLHRAIKSNQCLHCDIKYPDREALFEHMKRKQHRKLNAKNTTYDKYYIINYLELGRSWEDIMADEDTDIWRELKREEYNWSDWNEDVWQSFVCLFCDDEQDNGEKFKLHLNAHHNFNFDRSVVESYDYCFYDQVKIINYIRRSVANHRCHFCTTPNFTNQQQLLDHFAQSGHDSKLPLIGNWNDDMYLSSLSSENDAVFTLLKDVEDNVSVCEVEGIEREDFSSYEEASILQMGLDYIDENKLTAHSITVLGESHPTATGDHTAMGRSVIGYNGVVIGCTSSGLELGTPNDILWWNNEKNAHVKLHPPPIDEMVNGEQMPPHVQYYNKFHPYVLKNNSPLNVGMIPNTVAQMPALNPNYEYVRLQNTAAVGGLVDVGTVPPDFNNSNQNNHIGDQITLKYKNTANEKSIAVGPDTFIDIDNTMEQPNQSTQTVDKDKDGKVCSGSGKDKCGDDKKSSDSGAHSDDERNHVLMFDRMFQKCNLVEVASKRSSDGQQSTSSSFKYDKLTQEQITNTPEIHQCVLCEQ